MNVAWMRRTLSVLGWSVGAVSGIVVYLLLFEPPPLTYTNLPFPVLAPVVMPGDKVPLRIKRCNSTDRMLLATLTRTLENLDRREFVSMQSTVTPIQPGCTESTSLTNHVPLETPPGAYRVVGVAQVPGTLKTHYVTYYSAPFIVGKGGTP
jgi:hypothetical protein